MSARRFLLAVALVACSVPALVAQAPATPPIITWERVGDLQGGLDLLFSPGPTGDTLLAVGLGGEFGNLGVYRLAPGDTAWSDDLHPQPGSPFSSWRLASGAILIGAPAGPITIDRSADGGRTWDRVHDEHVYGLYQRPSNAAALAGAFQASDGVYGSADDGQTWTTLGRVTADEPSVPNVLIEHATAGPGGNPRLVAAVQNGLAYSDDDGQTWARSNVWGAFRWWGDDLQHAATVGPDAGGLYAAMSDFNDARAVVLYSTDGGATWEERGRPLIGFSTLAVGPGGALYLGVDNAQPGDAAKLMRSEDGGRTWAPVIAGYPNTCVESLDISPSDGRLYLSGCSGVWRTVEPLPIHSEPGPVGNGSAPAVGAAYPNPTAGGLLVPVVLPLAGTVRVAAYDVLGREVARRTAELGIGAHELALALGAVPAGVYVVRVEVGDLVRAQRVTVLR